MSGVSHAKKFYFMIDNSQPEWLRGYFNRDRGRVLDFQRPRRKIELRNPLGENRLSYFNSNRSDYPPEIKNVRGERELRRTALA